MMSAGDMEPASFIPDSPGLRAEGLTPERRIGSLRRSLIAALGHVKASPSRSLELRDHFSSMSRQIENARPHAELAPLVLELISVLHPLPIAWGEWTTWMEALRFALDVCERFDLPGLRIRFLSHMVNMLHYIGQFDRVFALCKEIRAHGRLPESASDYVSGMHTEILILMVQQELDAARERLEALSADPLFRSLPEPTRTEIDVRIGLIWQEYYRQTEHYPEALAILSNAIAALEQTPHTSKLLRADVYRCRGLIHWVTAAYPEAVSDYRRALDINASLNDTVLEGAVLGNLGLVHWSLGQYAEAEACKLSAVRTARALQASWKLCREQGDLALVHMCQGWLEQALAEIEDQLTLATRLDIQREIARAQGNRGIALFHLGRYDAAARDLIDDLSVMQSMEGVGVARVNLSRCLAAQGRAGEARLEAEQALSIAVEKGLPALETLALRALAEALPPSEALPVLQRGLALARRLSRRLDEAGCLFELARLAADDTARDSLWQLGVDLLDQMGAGGWLEAARGLPRTAPPRLPTIA